MVLPQPSGPDLINVQFIFISSNNMSQQQKTTIRCRATSELSARCFCCEVVSVSLHSRSAGTRGRWCRA